MWLNEAYGNEVGSFVTDGAVRSSPVATPDGAVLIGEWLIHVGFSDWSLLSDST